VPNTCLKIRELEDSPYPDNWSRRPKGHVRGNLLTMGYVSHSHEKFCHQNELEETFSYLEKVVAQAKSAHWSPNPEEVKFKGLADEWKRETAHSSSLAKKVMHPAYLRIIGMGPAAIPLILREMKSRPGHWFVALDAITNGDSPTQEWNTLEEATQAWIGWGESKGYL